LRPEEATTPNLHSCCRDESSGFDLSIKLEHPGKLMVVSPEGEYTKLIIKPPVDAETFITTGNLLAQQIHRNENAVFLTCVPPFIERVRTA
jgi:hypothetical protein